MTATLVLLALLCAPGLGAALAIAPAGGVALETRIGLVLGLGYAVVAGVAMALALAHVLSRPTFVVGIVVATVVAWVLALRRSSPRAHVSAIGAEIGAAPFALAAGLTVIVAVAATWVFYPPGKNLASLSPWRYWADGLEVAAAGGVPPTTHQWGAELPTAVDKVVLSAFEAVYSFLIGPDPLQAMYAMVIVSAGGLAAALLALGRELGLRTFAFLVPALVIVFPETLPVGREIAHDLLSFKAELIGRVAAVAALLVGILAVSGRGGIVLAALAGVVLALTALTHGVAGVVAAAALGLYGLAVLVGDRGRWLRVFATGGVVVLVAAVAYFGMLTLSRGDLGFQRVTSGPGFEGFPADIDPGRSFAREQVVRLRPTEGRFFVPPENLVRRLVKAVVHSGDAVWLGAVAIGALLVATVATVARERRFVPLAIVAWGLLVFFIAAAFAFSLRYRTQIPADFGPRRLYDYAALPTALIVPAALEALALLVLRRRPLVLGGVALALAAVAVVTAIVRIPDPEPGAPARKGTIAIAHVADVVPCGARMLPNGRTAGTWEAMTGRRSITEGLAPYLRPEVMRRVLPIVITAKRFFAAPRAHRAFLTRERVDYVVVVRPGVWVGGHPHAYPRTNKAAIGSLAGVRLVSSGPYVAIYGVGSAAERKLRPQPRRCPI